ncbi:MAG: MerR family transcriptional regulator [Bacteroidia bacterium]
MANEDEITPLFYTIGQVSRMLQLPESLLRFWEKEFTQLKPRKTSRGTRKYSIEDIETIKAIHQLVKIEGYTLDGAKEKLKKSNSIKTKTRIAEELMDLKEFLINLKNQL